MLYKTEWSWEIKTWPNEMKLLHISTTSSQYFYRKWIGETIENVNFHLLIERITCARFAILLWFYFIASLSWRSFQVHLFLWTEDSCRNSWKACKFGSLIVSGQRIVKYAIKIVLILRPLDYVFASPIDNVKSRLVPTCLDYSFQKRSKYFEWLASFPRGSKGWRSEWWEHSPPTSVARVRIPA